MKELEFDHYFHPVGQGLCASGVLRIDSPSEIRLRWVYDCGTSSSPTLIEDAVQQLHDWPRGPLRLDLVVLSHFDHDHISGVCRLIEKFKIGTLLLPYMPLHQRLIVALTERAEPGSDLMSFAINPVAHLTGRDGPGVEQIVFVPPSGTEGPPMPEGGPEGPETGEGGLRLRFREEEYERYAELEVLRKAVGGAGAHAKLAVVAKGESIRAPGLWEFVPYNDDPEQEIPDEFIEEVEAESSALLGAGSAAQRKRVLKALKQAYDRQFGDSSEERNMISLFLYSGPIYSSWKPGRPRVHCGIRSGRGSPWRGYLSESYWDSSWSPGDAKLSLLYTGDGYLDTPERLKRLLEYLRRERMERIAVLQVMHHGAEANWHKGVAAAIAPLWSVFSSDPDRKQWGHPHAAVLRGFWNWGPLQADKHGGVHTRGGLRQD